MNYVLSLRGVWIGFALNGRSVPLIHIKKVDRNQTIRYEIVPLSKIGIGMELPTMEPGQLAAYLVS